MLIHLLPLIFLNSWACYEIYKAKKILAALEEEIKSTKKLFHEIDKLNDRFYGLDNVTIRAIDSRITDIRMDIEVMKKKISLGGITHDSL